MVPNPYADAVTLPSKSSINAAKANRQFSRTISKTSSSDTTDSTDSASQIQNYIQQHYNVRLLARCRAAFPFQVPLAPNACPFVMHTSKFAFAQ